MPASSIPYRRLVVILIRPSKYDDEGYVVRHFRGTLPSNTLACLSSLTEEAVHQDPLDGLDVQVEAIDETVTRVDPRRLARRFRQADTKVVVGLVGVQSNQFPRAQDLARAFRAEGCEVMIGGFHVSGAMAMASATPPECQAMLDAGVTLVLGEVENRWADLLADAVADRLQPIYDLLAERPDLGGHPMPRASARAQRKYAISRGGTIDAGRGCPFDCSFCTIINVQGRRMRGRNAAEILRQVRENWQLGPRSGIRHYFFTDDNFARHPQWEQIFDGLIGLREEGRPIDFVMQVDALAPRIPGFVEKAARAGCVQVFIGLETIRDDNLEAGGKPQNKAVDYREMIARWHAVGVVCHAGYIIGFPHDTYERVMEDVRTLRDDLLVDQASFFMLMPLPGSRDHQRAVEHGAPIEADYNRFDSCHATTAHPRMSGAEWLRAYRDAWTEFYTFDQMRRTLIRQNPHTYWAVLKNLIWYRAAMIEGAHPMMTGFFRLKDRTSRRSTFPIEGRWRFIRRRARDVARVLRGYGTLFLEMQELWLRTRIRREEYAFLGDLRRLASRSTQEAKLNWVHIHAVVAERVAAWRRPLEPRPALSSTMLERIEASKVALGAVRDDLGRRARSLRDSVGARAGAVRNSLEASLSVAGRRLSARAAALEAALGDLRLPHLPPFRRCRPVVCLIRRLNLFSIERVEPPAHGVVDYWRRAWTSARELRIWRLNPVGLAWNFARDARHAVVFFYAMLLERY